jgi:hypothetical protein
MFPLAVGMISLGYTLVYYAGSMAKAFKRVHDENLTPNSKGGIPFGVLLGVNVHPTLSRDQKNLGNGQSFPPFLTTSSGGPTGDATLLPKDQPR